MYNLKFEGKKPKNKDLFNLIETNLQKAKDFIKSNGESEKPHDIVIVLLNVIGESLRNTGKEYKIEFLLEAIATYVNLFSFNERKKRIIFEKTMAKISDILQEKEGISPIDTLEILLENTKKVVV